MIISTGKIIDFDPINALLLEQDNAVKYNIKFPIGNARKEIIKKVVNSKIDDIAEIDKIVDQINVSFKSQINIIPPEPYFIVQVAENFVNHIGELVNNDTGVFSKVFEANITFMLEAVIKEKKKTIKVELMYLLLGKIAYVIHFNKKYPIERQTINNIVDEYNNEYGSEITTEDIIQICLQAKILIVSDKSNEKYRFYNKSFLAYFVAKEVLSKLRDTKDYTDIHKLIKKSCVNICTDILLFIVFQADDVRVLKYILSKIEELVIEDSQENEFDFKQLPSFLTGEATLNDDNTEKISKEDINKGEQEYEEKIASEFNIVDIYDWDDDIEEKYVSKIIRMTALLQIISKSFPCFEHLLKKEDKKLLIKYMYELPNKIFMFWSKPIDNNYSDIIEEIKSHPYMLSKSMKFSEKKDDDIKRALASYALNLLLTLYYIPVLNSYRQNTYGYLLNRDFFDYNEKTSYMLEHLMFLERNHSNEFDKEALILKSKLEKEVIPYTLLKSIVKHGMITRQYSNRKDIEKLQSAFWKDGKRIMLIERTKELMRGDVN